MGPKVTNVNPRCLKSLAALSQENRMEGVGCEEGFSVPERIIQRSKRNFFFPLMTGEQVWENLF